LTYGVGTSLLQGGTVYFAPHLIAKVTILTNCYSCVQRSVHQHYETSDAGNSMAMGINRHFSRAVAHGPYAQQGLNLLNLYMEQLVSHICTLLKFGAASMDTIGIL